MISYKIKYLDSLSAQKYGTYIEKAEYPEHRI